MQVNSATIKVFLNHAGKFAAVSVSKNSWWKFASVQFVGKKC